MSFNAPRREEYDGAKMIYLSFMDKNFSFLEKSLSMKLDRLTLELWAQSDRVVVAPLKPQ